MIDIDKGLGFSEHDSIIPAAPECLIDVDKDCGSSKHGSSTPPLAAASKCLIDFDKSLGFSEHDSIIPAAPECSIDVDKDLEEVNMFDVFNLIHFSKYHLGLEYIVSQKMSPTLFCSITIVNCNIIFVTGIFT